MAMKPNIRSLIGQGFGARARRPESYLILKWFEREMEKTPVPGGPTGKNSKRWTGPKETLIGSQRQQRLDTEVEEMLRRSRTRISPKLRLSLIGKGAEKAGRLPARAPVPKPRPKKK